VGRGRKGWKGKRKGWGGEEEVGSGKEGGGICAIGFRVDGRPCFAIMCLHEVAKEPSMPHPQKPEV